MSLAPTVLVVDDEPDVRFYLRTLLTENGFMVQEAADAEEALERLSHGRPDAMILDIMMPGRSGVTLFNKIRKRGDLKGLSVIVLTGVHDRFIEDFKAFFDALKLGKPLAFMEKPVDPSLLLGTLRQAVESCSQEEMHP